jgi:cytochrome P450
VSNASAEHSAGGIDLDTYDPTDRAVQQCPFDHYAALRAHGPVFHDRRTGMYFVSRHDVVNAVLRDTDTFSSHGSNTKTQGSPEAMRRVAEILAEGWPSVDTMLTVDPPRHTRYRKLVAAAFSPRRIAALEDTVRAIAVELIDAMPSSGTVDFHRDFAVAFPVRVIHHTLGMAPETLDLIKEWSAAFNVALGAAPTDERRIEAARRMLEVQQYWHREYQDRRSNPIDDILSDLVHADFEDPDLPDGATRKLEFPEVFGIIRQLMVAGNETSTMFLTETVRLLVEHPHWWEALADDSAAVVHGVVEEGLRISSPNQGLFRLVTRDTEIEGIPIPAGSRIWVMFAAANRDERVFDDAESFDPGRPRLKEHVAFGKGHHFCIGAPLTRLEGKVAFEELPRRLRVPTFSADNSFQYEPSFVLRGLAGLRLDIEKR